MTQHILTKTDYIHYLNCPKSLWLLKNKPKQYPYKDFSEFLKKITCEGYEVERYAMMLFPDGVVLPSTHKAQKRTQEEIAKNTETLFQPTFQTPEGFFVRADVLRRNSDGTYTLYEIKSSSKVKVEKKHNHIKDICFQKLVLERAGIPVTKTVLIHINGEYKRKEVINPKELLLEVDLTEKVLTLESEVSLEMQNALSFIKEKTINEGACTCCYKTRSNHCDSFRYFNGDLEVGSVYDLCRVSEKKIQTLLGKNIKKIADISDEVELSDTQVAQICSAKKGHPTMSIEEIKKTFANYAFPLYFLDYETVQSAVPEIIDARPWQQIPFQFSLHILQKDGTLTHREYIGDAYNTLDAFIEALEESIGKVGSVISWNKSFEQTVNKGVIELRPYKREFLEDVNARMLDLMDIFKKMYVDSAFCGSSSIKKVLPVMCPDLSYKKLTVQDGAQAMSQWEKMIDSKTPNKEKKQIRDDLLEYCKLDTFAMVEIYRAVNKVIR